MTKHIDKLTLELLKLIDAAVRERFENHTLELDEIVRKKDLPKYTGVARHASAMSAPGERRHRSGAWKGCS
jgi:hypothetical protein